METLYRLSDSLQDQAKLDSEFFVETLLAEDTEEITMLIRRNLGAFEEVGSVLTSAFRRVEDVSRTYSQPGNLYFIAKHKDSKKIVGGAGIGPLAGLPFTEGIGEIRELVIDENYRSRGLGRALLQVALDEARALNYKTIYLETTPQMVMARRLFEKFGFRAVTQLPSDQKNKNSSTSEFPCYYLLESIAG